MSTATAHAAVNKLYEGDRASQALGIEILSVEPGRVRVAMAIRPDMTNGHGICHGGVLFTLADSAFAFACNSHGDPMVAAGASIEYLIPVRAGERVIAAAAEVSRSERHGIYDVEITTASGETVAQFRGRCARLRTHALTTASKDGT
jgi:acyl-CoA thioesterase